MSEPLSLWNKTPTRQAILDFVAAVTDESGPSYVPPAERIATFDNDGTLWCEIPAYIMECATGFPGYDDRMPFQNGILSEMLLEHGYNTLVSWTQTHHEQSGKEKPHDLDRD